MNEMHEIRVPIAMTRNLYTGCTYISVYTNLNLRIVAFFKLLHEVSTCVCIFNNMKSFMHILIYIYTIYICW